MSSSLKKPKRRKHLRKSAKSAEKIPGELIPQSGIYVGMLERLFEAFGCKLTTVKVVKSNLRPSVKSADKSKPVTHSHYEQAKPRRKK